MIFNKVIYGTVLSYSNANEVKVPVCSNCEREFKSYDHEFTELYEHDIHRESLYYHEYYISYEKLSIQYTLNNAKHCITFDKVLLKKKLKISDSVRLNYNRISKKVDILE